MSLEKYRRFRWFQNQLNSKPSLEIIFYKRVTFVDSRYTTADIDTIESTQPYLFQIELLLINILSHFEKNCEILFLFFENHLILMNQFKLLHILSYQAKSFCDLKVTMKLVIDDFV